MFTPLEAGERFSFDQSTAYFRDLRLIASYSCGPNDTREALMLIEQGVVKAEHLHAKLFGLHEVVQAYESMRTAEVTKAIVVP